MQKIEATRPEAQSADIVASNIEQLKALFPELITEGVGGVSVNMDILKALVGDHTVTDADEKYGLNWHGKRRARQLALTPSTGTLRPCPDESVDWDTTQNLMIEGDNLEVLKLLQKSYAGKVKLIYIDPPYNTGKDFVYPDNFQDNIKNYLELTGQVEGGQKISSNTEASGRFHTDWLNMMYPRLKLARALLRQDGVIMVSMDDHEFYTLRFLMNEVFGEEAFIGVFVWKRRTGAMDSVNNFSTDHEYVIAFSKSAVTLNGDKRTFERYENPDNDPRGPWIADNLSAAKPGGDTYYPVRDPVTGNEFFPPKGRYWPYSKATMKTKIAEGRIIFPKQSSGSPLLKRFQNEAKSLVEPVSSWIVPLADKASPDESVTVIKSGLTSEGTKAIKELFNDKVFTYAKPMTLLRALIQQATQPGDGQIVMDFFAGSATTGHSMLAQNASDGGNRRYILVQLPEHLSNTIEEQKLAAAYCDELGKPRTIVELTKERLRRAAAKVKADNPLFAGDTGFRVFKLDHSNIRAWNPNPADLEQTLFAHQDHLVEGRTESDILYELLLKLGLDLCVPIEQRTINGKHVHSVGGGVLMACLAPSISRDDIESLAQGIVAWNKELAPAGDTTCVFRDSAFADDVAKTNLAAILEQHGIQNVRSL